MFEINFWVLGFLSNLCLLLFLVMCLQGIFHTSQKGNYHSQTGLKDTVRRTVLHLTFISVNVTVCVSGC